MNRQRLIRIAINLLILLVFMLQTSANTQRDTRLLPFLDNLERWTYDLRLQATLPGGVDRRIVIVNLDEKSLESVGHWPWPRDIMAALTTRLFQHYGVTMIGFDMVFAEHFESSALPLLSQLAQQQLAGNAEYQRLYKQLKPGLEHDRLFAEALQQGIAVLGFTASRRPGLYGALPRPLNILSDADLDPLPLYERKGLTANLAILQNSALQGGFFDNPAISDDGLFRRVPLIYRFEDQIYPTLSLAMMLALYGENSIGLDITPGSPDHPGDLHGLSLLGQPIPVDEQGATLIPYRGPSPSFPYVSAMDVLDGSADADVLDGSIVLFGTTAPGLLDMRATPIQPAFPGVEVHANVLAGILNVLNGEIEGALKTAPDWILAYELVLLACIGLILGISLAWLGPLAGIALSLLLAGLDITLNVYAWQTANLVLPIASHLALILVLLLFNSAYGYLVETRNKHRLGRVFGHYVPPEIVEEMSENESDFGLHGESRDMTVLFSDVRGFTTISEGLAPDQLTELMNAFLTPMTAAIHEHRGTIDKYMGDAVMAFWGAPLKQDNHAHLAVTAALSMNDRVVKLKPEFQARGWPAIEIGIGLNTGTMNVGNMGSEFRMAYTVLGDSVNLGSRLEGLTKHYGVRIVVSESTRQAAPGFVYRDLDRVRVKGKQEPVTIYEPLMPLEGDVHSDQGQKNANTVNNDLRQRHLDRYHQALKLYRQQHWEESEQLFRQLQDFDPQSKLYPLYLERIEQLRQTSLPEDWDAVFVYQSK